MKNLQKSFLIGAMVVVLSGCQSARVGTQDTETVVDRTGSDSAPIEQEQEQEDKMQAMGDSLYEGGYVNVRGYAEETAVDEAWCEEDCDKYQYVSFYVVPSDYDNETLNEFIKGNGGNSYIGDASIGLGCNEDGVIVYDNDSDRFGYKTFTLAEDVSAAILGSSEENPIDVQLIKEPLTGGRGAMTCYSHFTDMKLL